MTEKQLFKNLMKRFAIVMVVYILITLVLDFTCGKTFTDVLKKDFYGATDYSASDLVAVVVDPDVLEVTMIEGKDDAVYVTINGLKKGETIIEFDNKTTGEILFCEDYTVSGNLTVQSLTTGNYSNWKLQRIMVFLLMVVCTLLLWQSFFEAQKKAGYSYHAIFCCGFGIWNILADLEMLIGIFRYNSMSNMYSQLQSAGDSFMFWSIPFVLVFAVALSVSNISLIRHEGFRTRNALGIGISLAMILGEVIDLVVSFSNFSGSEFEYRLFNAQHGTYCSVYCLLECFLLGAVICGSLAAKREPKYDKDYIVILGCRVAKDGTLYPLIRGRVDRAISFYRAQLAKTGKKAVFVPSGGQGSDEQISEADAMKRYLLEQGFTEDDIMVENQSKNTMQNMKFSKKLIEERTPGARCAFSTTNYHVFRSGIISRQQNFDAEGMGGKTKWYFWPNAYVREMIGMMTYCWKRLAVILVLMVAFFAVLAFA